MSVFITQTKTKTVKAFVISKWETGKVKTEGESSASESSHIPRKGSFKEGSPEIRPCLNINVIYPSQQ